MTARPATSALVLFTLMASGGISAVKKTKRRAPVPAAVSAKERQAALDFIAMQTGQIENAAALVPFFEQLASGAARAPIHILHYGDSHTASDDWANTIRQRLQSRFGSGGFGFALAGYPFRGYRRLDITAAGGSKGWRTQGTVGTPGDGRNGLGGISIHTDTPGQTVSFTADCTNLKLLYLVQPGGGTLEFSIDSISAATIATDGELGPGTFERETPAGSHQYTLRTLDASPVRLFGWIGDRTAGVTYEALGINGAQIGTLLDWDEKILSDHLAKREPALIVLAYGTNEALRADWTPESYAEQFSRVLDRFRRASPLASILVIGPPDCQFRSRRGFTTAHLDGVVAVQRQVATLHGCAFWDWRARMGGEGAILKWIRAGQAQPDHVHLTSAGYQTTGDMLMEDLMEQYRRFLAVKAE